MIITNDKTKQEVFQEITEHLIKDKQPSDYIKSISDDEEYCNYPFTLLWKMKETEQSKIYHPEGSVWNHTMLVLDEAARVREKCKDVEIFMWAALLHDIGKPGTTRIKKGKITSYDHDREGERLCVSFLEFFTADRIFIEQVSALVRYHMHMLYVMKKLPYADVKGMLYRVDKKELALLCRCDRLGREGVDKDAEEAEYQEFEKILKSLK